LVEARPRSGYFVRAGRTRALPPAAEPLPTLPDPAQYIGVHPKVSAIIAAGQQASIHTQFASAVGAPSLYPLAALQQASQRALRQHPALYGQGAPAAGDAGLRTVLAKRALTVRMNLTADDILITQGCIEALNLALRAVTQPGDTVAVESPTFFGLLQVMESLGLKALEIPASPQTGLSMEALELAAQTYANIRAVVVVPTLQNPLGSIMPDAQKAALEHWCDARGIALIEDDTYADLIDDDTPLPALKAWDQTGNVIHCASFHKTLAPGIRLGWIAGGRWHARIAMLKYTQSRANDLLPQLAVADFMASGGFDRHLRRFRRTLQHQRQQLADAIAGHFPTGTRLTIPRGGLTLWVALPAGNSSEALFHAALQRGIRIAPGTLFSNSARFDGYIRLSCGNPYTREVDIALRQLAVLVKPG
jgi:DNA-binding transcriptional MocR family regulator